MATQILPASPSWYSSRVIDCDERGVLCFGAKNTIYLLDVSHGGGPVYIGSLAGHKDRVVGLSISPDTQVFMCCSAAEDGCVKVWNVTDKTELHEHSHHNVINQVLNSNKYVMLQKVYDFLEAS